MARKQSVIRFAVGVDNMEIIVTYDTKEPENYIVTYAYHNGKDVTDFYHFCETQQECLLYPQIVEGIAGEICGERLFSRKSKVESRKL